MEEVKEMYGSWMSIITKRKQREERDMGSIKLPNSMWSIITLLWCVWFYAKMQFDKSKKVREVKTYPTTSTLLRCACVSLSLSFLCFWVRFVTWHHIILKSSKSLFYPSFCPVLCVCWWKARKWHLFAAYIFYLLFLVNLKNRRWAFFRC